MPLFLAGCLSATEIKMKRQEAVRSECSSYGYNTGTTAFAECAERTTRENNKRRAKALQDLSRDLQNVGNKRSTCTTTGPYYNRVTTCF